MLLVTSSRCLSMVDLSRITTLHEQATLRWHDPTAVEAEPPDPLDRLVLAEHRANFDLWHREDLARDPDADHRTIAEVKRSIDTLNQQRNDLVEQLDAYLLSAAGPQEQNAPLHSETPGLMIDRLSILALKLFHTAEEARRIDASPGHRERNAARLAVLREQHMDLAGCLEGLWQDILAGRRRFKLYRQFKMYNDPTLNPVLRKARPGL